MIIGKEELDRIEELKHNESLLYNCKDYLIKLFKRNNETNLQIEERFKELGFTDDDIKKLEIGSE